jgi:serine/threonine protein kinase
MSYATNVYIFLHISHFVCISSVQVFQVEKIDTGAIYAMKVLRKDFIIKSQAVENTIAEREILRKVRHPFLISLHYAFQTEGKLYLVMDFANGGQLFDHLVKH